MQCRLVTTVPCCQERLDLSVLGILNLGNCVAHDLGHSPYKVNEEPAQLTKPEPHNLGYCVTPLLGFWGFPCCLAKSGSSPPMEAWDPTLEFLRVAKMYLKKAQLCICPGLTM